MLFQKCHNMPSCALIYYKTYRSKKEAGFTTWNLDRALGTHILKNFVWVEGLLKKGAMKPDDRPLWFDIYKAFPPIDEPTFFRPIVEDKPVKKIFYTEDVVRAKLHSQKLGLGTVNMLSAIGESQTKKLLQKYNALKAEGVPEEEIIQKCAESVENEKHQRYSQKKLDLDPKSVSAQVLGDINIKDIFDATLEKNNEN